jgi:hypothetical protein
MKFEQRLEKCTQSLNAEANLHSKRKSRGGNAGGSGRDKKQDDEKQPARSYEHATLTSVQETLSESTRNRNSQDSRSSKLKCVRC